MSNKPWAAAVWAGLAGLPAMACSGDSQQFVILQNQVPRPGCVIDTNRTIYRGSGVLDVALVDAGSTMGYELFPLVQNGLDPAGQGGGNEPNRIVFKHFRVRVELGESASAEVSQLFKSLPGSDDARLVEYDEPWSGSVEPGGVAATSVTGIPAELARRIQATRALDQLSGVTVMVHARLVGTHSDDSIASGEIVYPVRVCAGCLIANVRECPYQAVNTGNVCNIAQDEAVDCCTEGKSLFCPARPPPQQQ